MEHYNAEDFISFIENGRRDKISPNAIDLIAKRFRELEIELEEANDILVKSERNYVGKNAQLEKELSEVNIAKINADYIEKLISDYKNEELPNCEKPFHYEAEIASGLECFIKWMKNKEKLINK